MWFLTDSLIVSNMKRFAAILLLVVITCVIQAACSFGSDGDTIKSFPVDGDGAHMILLVTGMFDDVLPRAVRHIDFNGYNLPKGKQGFIILFLWSDLGTHSQATHQQHCGCDEQFDFFLLHLFNH